jgi:hypothetical protein
VRRGGIYGRARRRLRAAEQPGAVERGSGVRRDLAWAGAAAADTSALSCIDTRQDKAQVATPTEVEPITIEYLREGYWEKKLVMVRFVGWIRRNGTGLSFLYI